MDHLALLTQYHLEDSTAPGKRKARIELLAEPTPMQKQTLARLAVTLRSHDRPAVIKGAPYRSRVRQECPHQTLRIPTCFLGSSAETGPMELPAIPIAAP